MAERNKQVVLRLFELALQSGVTDALDLIADDYVEHSPVIPAGKQGLAEFLHGLASREQAPRVLLHRVVADDEHVVVHYHATTGSGDPGSAVADIFRLRDGAIVEHWDVVQPLPEAVPSGNPAF
jgi:predicted SnoaL-like aldol condensation-catalyzing enzyme